MTKAARLVARAKLAGFAFSAERCLDLYRMWLDGEEALTSDEKAQFSKAYEAVRCLRVNLDWDTAHEADGKRRKR